MPEPPKQEIVMAICDNCSEIYYSRWTIINLDNGEYDYVCRECMDDFKNNNIVIRGNDGSWRYAN